jgi:hypothetical protein
MPTVRNVECYEPVQVRFTENVSKAVREVQYKFDLVGVQEVSWDKGGTERAEDYTFFYEEGNGDHQLGTGFSVRLLYTPALKGDDRKWVETGSVTLQID